MVEPSCPVLVILDDDAFRTALIKKLDEKHFTVTFAADGDESVAILEKDRRSFHIILLGLDLASKRGMRTLEYLSDHREKIRCGIIIIGDPNPQIRTYAPWVNETLLRPVDADYVAQRARTYCNC